MKKRFSIVIVMMSLLTATSFALTLPTHSSDVQPVSEEKGATRLVQHLLVEEWRYHMFWRYEWGFFGSSPAIADLGPDVNDEGGEPNSDMEIITGSDEYSHYFSELGAFASGIWRCLDSGGNLEWAKDSKSDETRGSAAIVDINDDGDLEIAGGTTSGETVEVMDHSGNFVWTFPKPPRQGSFYYPGAPAVADLDPTVDGLEVVVGNRPYGTVLAFDGDNSDGVNDGISAGGIPGSPYGGTEGVDWDLLWYFDTDGRFWSSPALDDVDNDGTLEVVIGCTDGNVYVLDGSDGSLEHTFSTGGAVYSSAALANLDGDTNLEIVIGSTDNNMYCFQWDGATGITEWTYLTGGQIYSSAGIGDVDNDLSLEIVVGSNDGNVYSIGASGIMEWICPTGGAVYSSPALANADTVSQYAKDWPMFRNNPSRTGLYGKAVPPTLLDVYVGSDDGYLYLIDGSTGAVIDQFQVYTDAGKGIHTSPSVADIDGDSKLEIVFYDWGRDSNRKGNTFWCLEDATVPVGYTVVIAAFCWTEGKYVSVNITMDGEPTGHTTPHAFYNLIGTHNFTVPDYDPNGDLFEEWNTGEPSTTITVDTAGAFIAYYGKDIHDVAVKSLTCFNKTIVGQDCSMYVNVTVENQGNFTETFNVIVYQDDFKPEWEIFWVKGDVNGDGYIDGSDQNLITAAFASTPGAPNWNPAADLDKDGLVDFNDVTMLAYNYGLNISGYLEVPPTIGRKQLVIALPPSQETTVTITLNTTGIDKGNYTLSAYAIPVLGEVDMLDNSLTNGWILVVRPGDINADTAVNYLDGILLGAAFDCGIGHERWNPNADLNGDEYINYLDAIILGGNFDY